MNEPDDNEERIARLLDLTLRRLPSQAAPPTLESRVLGELARRAGLPWWRRSFAHWPSVARAAFLLMCGSLVGGLYLSGDWSAITLRSWHESGALSVASVRDSMAILTAAGELGAVFAHAIPSTWLYAGLTAGALLYAFLFGLGSAAYRTLYLNPHDGR
jgi:uncharacterized membrane protein YfcA